MSDISDANTSIRIAYECIRRILELDTQDVAREISLMEEINNNATPKFRDLESYASEMKIESDVIREFEVQLAKDNSIIYKIENSLSEIENLLMDMDNWTQDLDMKFKTA